MSNKKLEIPSTGITAKGFLFLMAIGVVLLFLFYPETFDSINWGGITGLIGLLLAIVLWMSFVMLERSARVTVTKLKVGGGSCEGLHPDDLRLTPFAPGKPSWAIIAQGGFTAGGIEMKGKKRFLVFLSAFGQEMSGVYTVHANLKPAKYSEMSAEIQHELNQLKHFNVAEAEKRNNIYFSMTSDYYGKASIEDLELENMFKLNSLQINKLRSQLHDAYDEINRRQGNQGSWAPPPNYVEVPE